MHIHPYPIIYQKQKACPHCIICSLALLLCVVLSVSVSFCQELPFTQYTPENEINPLPSADVRSIYQDRLGYIWMVVYSSGLLRYDGHLNERYTTEDGLPGLDVRQVMEDQLGRLWVASEQGLTVTDRPLSQYEEHYRIHFATRIGSKDLFKNSLVENRLAQDSRGWLWVGTPESGIIRYQFSRIDTLTVDTIATDIFREGKNRDIRSIVVRQDGSVWVSVGGGSILVFHDASKTFDVLNENNGLPRLNTDVLCEGRSGILLGGCSNGSVWKLTNRGNQYRCDIISTELKSRITCIFETLPGTFWVGSEGSGILKIFLPTETQATAGGSQHTVVITKRNGLLSDNISNIYEDREKNIWITQVGGVSKLRANYAAFTNYTAVSHGGAKPDLPNPSINVIIPLSSRDDSQNMWVGTSGGGIALIKSGVNVESIQTDRGLKHNWVNGLAIDVERRLWIGTTSGINCFSTDPQYPPPPSDHTQSISLGNGKGTIASYENTTIYACKTLDLPVERMNGKKVESIWLLGYQHLYCFTEGEWFIFRTSSGLPATYFDAVTFDDNGKLLVGTRDAGLYRSSSPVTLTTLRSFQHKDFNSRAGGRKFGDEVLSPLFEPYLNQTNGAPSNQIETMAWHDKSLWIGTPEGLVVIESEPPKITSRLTKADGLKGNDVTSLAFSPASGSLWAGTNGGLAEIDPSSRKVKRTITKQDGLVDNEVWFYGSVAVGDDGTVYFGTSKGLSSYTPQLDNTNPNPPLIHLQKAFIREEANGDNEIAFEYAALSFANERLVRYRTRLIGYDKDWSSEKTEVSIRYTNLPAFLFPRQYTFEVTASNNYGIWTDAPLQYTFSIQPPWWFRWWWLASNVLLLVALVYAYSRHRIKSLEQRSRELEKTVEARTHEIKLKAEEIRTQAGELAKKNTELEEKNLEIIKTQEQLIMQEKLASLGALTAGIAHEIKNPLNFVNNFAEISVELTNELREDLETQKDRLEPKILERLEETLNDLEHNSTKINEHGKRADSIVRGMLLHSRGKSGERMPTDINTLLDEYVSLAYHGLRAQDTSFNITIQTNYDKSIEPIDVVPQDLSRVFLNIVNNACYAANEKKKSAGQSFSPVLSVCTKNFGDKIEVRIRDNGTGIPKELVDKIFDPFFTTKPTGKGTGLGLSLSYDIVVKQHGGELKVETENGSFTEFIIRLPKQHK